MNRYWLQGQKMINQYNYDDSYILCYLCKIRIKLYVKSLYKVEDIYIYLLI